jgi:hypothetical protein
MKYSSIVVAGVLVAAVAAACGSSGGNSSFGNGGDAGADGTVAADASRPPLNQDASLPNPDAVADTGPGMPHGCDVSCMVAGGTCTNNACSLRENPGALTAAQQQTLQAGGAADPAV